LKIDSSMAIAMPPMLESLIITVLGSARIETGLR
jgi:hypothetical protein